MQMHEPTNTESDESILTLWFKPISAETSLFLTSDQIIFPTWKGKKFVNDKN